MSYQFSPATHGLPSLAQYLPPGCKFLSCHDAQNVLRSCSTWRLPNGTLVAPLGGELYQVVEVPTNCDERCSYHEVRCGFFFGHFTCQFQECGNELTHFTRRAPLEKATKAKRKTFHVQYTQFYNLSSAHLGFNSKLIKQKSKILFLSIKIRRLSWKIWKRVKF